MTEKQWSGVIAVEGVPSVDGRTIQPEALSLPKGSVALIATNSWRVIGSVEKIERQGALIRASGVIREDVAEVGLALSTRDQKVVTTKGHTTMTITAAEIAAVYVTERPAWQECVFDA